MSLSPVVREINDIKSRLAIASFVVARFGKLALVGACGLEKDITRKRFSEDEVIQRATLRVHTVNSSKERPLMLQLDSLKFKLYNVEFRNRTVAIFKARVP